MAWRPSRRALRGPRVWWTFGAAARYNEPDFFGLRGYPTRRTARTAAFVGTRFPSSQVTSMNKFVGKHVVIAALSVLAGYAANAQAADVVGNAKAGQDKVAMCSGCHGIPEYRTAYPEVFRVPKLGGQNQAYLENALRAYKKGDRHFATMHAIAVTLSDQDIADVAAYYAAQTAASKNNPDK
ncbi:cytochrome c553 [Paraburkholderia sp. MM5496-R1]